MQAPCFDEARLADGSPRLDHADLLEVLQAMGPTRLADRATQRDAYLDRHGITFTLGERERPLPLDLVPRLISAADWRHIESGVVQRIRALEQFLADIYGPAECIADGIIPASLVTSSTHFHRVAWGLRPANDVRIHVCGSDLIRDEEGRFLVLEDNLRNPSGVSYVLENRRTLAHVVPEVFAAYRVRSVTDYPTRLLEALRACAPPGVDDPTVVVLTPGVHNAAHYEHAFLARHMGVELVEGRDLYCQAGHVWMRTTAGPAPVHVVYRRIDDDFLDPVHLRADSILGIPGIVNCARAGTVAIANAIGNGVADDKAVYPYVPALIRYYLGQEPILPNVPTYDLADPDQRAEVLASIDRMVIKPSDASGGYGLLMGPTATEEQIEQTVAELLANPRGWIAQPVVRFSTCPTVMEDGTLAERHVDLRPFAVNDGTHITVLPGGLSRVALPEGSLVVNSSQGGGSKDTWVLDDGAAEPIDPEESPGVRLARLRRAAATIRQNPPNGHDDRIVQQERQQQQARC